MNLADGFAPHTGVVIAEVGFLLILFAGIWFAAAEIPALKASAARRIVTVVADQPETPLLAFAHGGLEQVPGAGTVHHDDRETGAGTCILDCEFPAVYFGEPQLGTHAATLASTAGAMLEICGSAGKGVPSRLPQSCRRRPAARRQAPGAAGNDHRVPDG